MTTEKYRIGRITRCIGLKGEVSVFPETYGVERFLDLKKVYIGRSETSAAEYTITSARLWRAQPILKFDTVDSRSDAEHLMGSTLFVDESERIELPNGVHFIHDLIGTEVVDEQGDRIGTISDVLLMPAHPVYVVRTETGECMVPAIDEFVIRRDIPAGKIVIRPIEGLIG